MPSIRKYQEKDRENVELVCAGTSDERMQDKPGMREMLLTVFCHYYIEQEPDNCFVLANDDDEAVGYVLCAKDFDVWKEQFNKGYLKKTKNLMTKFMGKGSIDGMKAFAKEYPAHLHIDILPDYQRQGWGTKLVDTLKAHLREQGVTGLMFCVGTDNETGKSFYNKYGFEVLEARKHDIAMGTKL